MGFLRALFDIRFREMITGKIIVFLYVIAMIAIGLAYIGAVVNGFNNGVGTGLLVYSDGASQVAAAQPVALPA